MKIILTNKEICKILATLSLEEIDNRKEYNWSVWKTPSYIGDEVYLEREENKDDN